MKININKICRELPLHIPLVFAALMCLLPLLWVFGSALKTQETIFTDFSLIPKSPMWKNFYDAWTKAEFGRYFLNSLFYTIVVVTCIVLISSFAAFAFSRLNFKFKNTLYYLFLAVLMIPVPGAIVGLYLLLNKLGLVNTIPGYLLPQVNGGIPFGVYLMKTFIDKVPRELDESAYIEGCNTFKLFWQIIFPLTKPAMSVLIIFNVLAVWNEYMLAMLVLSDKSLMPIQRGLMVFQGAHFVNYPLLMSGVIITIVPVVITYILMQKYIISGIIQGALKG